MKRYVTFFSTLCLLVMGMLCWSAPVYARVQNSASSDQTVLAKNESASQTAKSSESPRRRIHAMRRQQDITIDGRLDEPAWQQAPVVDGFKQREPVEGADASEPTEVRILYDDEAIFIGARMYDSAPDSIIARLGRRDARLEADLFGFFIDPYHDRRTGFYFGVNAAGTLLDGVLMNDDWDDDSWDGIWQGKVKIDDKGWTAEMRIPYSQLRFHEQEEYTWGVNFRRDIARKNEQQYLVYTPRSESGFVSRFVDLVGIEQISPPRQLEITPYVTARAAYTDAEAGDPFNDGSTYTPDLGADFKIGLTSNLTLNGTVNPDFGQVEVDPAVVNLSDVETFFPEKRPFFIEGASIFNFGFGGSNNFWGFNFGNPDFLYSRRIGRAPQGSLPDYDYADRPDGTTIIGAAKLTGKVGSNWNVGTIQAVTARSIAEATYNGEKFRAEVEPATYYGIMRGQREFREGRQALGFISTTAVRDFSDDRLADEINSRAYTFGLDGWTFLDREKVWVITGWMGLSHVRGNETRITDLQRSSLHYFQRPDASHVKVDSSATSLTGLGGRLMLNKQSGRFYTNAAVGFFSPSFDLNDVGYIWNSDVINGHIVLGYRWFEPKSFYRRIFINTSHFQSYDFDGNRTQMGFWGNSSVQFKNFYSVYAGGRYAPSSMNARRTRGGPLMRDPTSYLVFGGAESDSRKAFVFNAEGYRWWSEGGSREADLSLSVEWRPASSMSLRVGPELYLFQNAAQYVSVFDDPTATATYGQRYVFADLDQKTFSANIRLNWTFTPLLSFQLFAQPLISAGAYTEFKELARPRSFDFNVYGRDNGSTIDEDLRVDPDGAGTAEAFEIDNPDFNYKSLRGTAVLRWEFRPGSTLYLVWTQTRDDFEDVGDFRFGRSFDTLFGAKADNIFMLKLTYWLSR